MPNFRDPGLEPDDDERYAYTEVVFDDDPVIIDDYISGIYGRTKNVERFLRTRSEEDKAARCARIIDYMAKTERMDLTTFLKCISWGLKVDKTSKDYGVIRYSRTGFLHSDDFEEILQIWCFPPRRHQAGIRTQGGKGPLERWAEQNIKMRMNEEMKNLIPVTLSPPEELSEESLLSFSLTNLRADFEKAAPLTWRILFAASTTPLQMKRSKKDPAPVRFSWYLLGTVLTCRI